MAHDLHWLTVDGERLGLWQAVMENGAIILTPVALGDVDNKDLFGKTGYIDWRVQ